MAFSSVMSAVLQGLFVLPVFVEADVSNGLPTFHMVGYLSSEVREASERVRTAIKNTGIQIPAKKIIVNLAPATVKKKGASFDLPIALSVLGAMSVVPTNKLENTLVIGELSLDGALKKVSGVLPIVMEAKKLGMKRCILPKENMLEGLLVDGIEIIGVDSLEETIRYLKSGKVNSVNLDIQRKIHGEKKQYQQMDYCEVHGQEAVKRAVEVAVAGGHNILFLGPPGSGKTMIAQRIPTILPLPSKEESMDITKIYSVLGLINEEDPLITGRPFRNVHHTVTKAALIGGGGIPIPGEISLAHGGV